MLRGGGGEGGDDVGLGDDGGATGKVALEGAEVEVDLVDCVGEAEDEGGVERGHHGDSNCSSNRRRATTAPSSVFEYLE